MKLIQRLGSALLALALVLTLLQSVALAADDNGYQLIEGYTASSGLTVEQYSVYPWTYDASADILTSGNPKSQLAKLKVTASRDGVLKFDYALTSAKYKEYFNFRIGADFDNYNDVYTSSGAKSGDFDFKTGEIAVTAGQIVYIAYAKNWQGTDADFCRIKNIRLVTNGTITLSSSDASLGTVSASLDNLSDLAAGTEVTLTATETGGKFDGWYETVGSATKQISDDKVFTYTVKGDAAIEGRFVSVSTNAVATVNGVGYDSLSEALASAQITATAENPVVVKLVQDVTVTEDLTVPANVTLLVPYETEDQGNDPVYGFFLKDTNRQKGNAYRKLTVANGVNITVNGTLLVNAWLGSSDTGHQGSIGSDYGLMELNGNLTVNNGGALKVRGMLTGTGHITAHSGGNVMQAFEMTDWPGGSEAAARNGRGEFPISQYYFQRIQVPTTFEYGATMGVYGYLFVPSEGNSAQLEMKGLIGTSDTSFFKMKEGSSLTIGYVPNSYTSTFDVYGEVEVRSFNISMASYSISTAGMVCPIPASFEITAKEGAELTITEDMKLMPGALLTIEAGATVNLEEGNALYLYGTSDYSEPRAIPSSSNATVPITPTSHANILTYGVLNINGMIHTSAGVNVEAQVVTMTGGQVNGSENISQGTVGQTLISYNGNGGSGKIASHYAKTGEAVTLATNTFSRPGFIFKGWSADPDFPRDPFNGTETLITNMNIAAFPEIGIANVTLFAVWEQEQIDSSSYPLWRVKGTSKVYGYATDAASYMVEFNKAMEAAKSSGGVLVLVNDGTLPAGDYTIPKGVAVLIPYSSSESFDKNPLGVAPGAEGVSTYQYPTTPYRMLTMAPGAKLTVNGALNVGSRIYSGPGGASTAGAPTGNSARIYMQSTSQIVVNGTLYAYGFIYGAGSVSAESGSHIHEMFQLTEQRGGSYLMNLTRDKFPVTQYYVQNIEVPLTYKYGCTETMHTNMYILDQQNPINDIAFLGSGSGLFQMSSDAEVVRTYDSSTDRLIWDVYGDITFASTVLDVQGMATLDTTQYTLPLTNNFTINIHTGTTQLLHRMELLPGVQVTIDHGATLYIAQDSRLWVYDRDSWVGKGFVFDGRDISPVVYSPTKQFTRTVEHLVDASINVNGSIKVYGKMYSTMSDADKALRDAGRPTNTLYTPTSGANIYTSEGTGEVYLHTQINYLNADTAKIVNGDSGIGVPAISVLLHNVDASGAVTSPEALEYTHTHYYPAKTTFKWCAEHGRWENGTMTVNFDANGGEGSKSVTVHRPGVIPAVADQLSKGTLRFKGWNTKADGSGTGYEDGFVANSPDTTLTLYAQWEGSVTWVYGDKSTTKILNEGETPVFKGADPTKAEDDRYTYTFAGWATEPEGEPLSEIPPMTGDVTYYAVFVSTIRSYTVTWKNDDGTILDSQTLNYGETPVYNGKNTDELKTSASPSDGVRVDTVFERWSPAVTAVTGNQTYTAIYITVKYYAIRFFDSDNSKIDTYMVQQGKLFATPDAPEAPTGYEFAGWATSLNGEPSMSLPAATAVTNYYAVYKRIGSGLEGDIDGNGTVNSADLSKLLANYNKSGSGLDGDIDGNGTVNSADLSKLLANYNKSLS